MSTLPFVLGVHQSIRKEERAQDTAQNRLLKVLQCNNATLRSQVMRSIQWKSVLGLTGWQKGFHRYAKCGFQTHDPERAVCLNLYQ